MMGKMRSPIIAILLLLTVAPAALPLPQGVTPAVVPWVGRVVHSFTGAPIADVVVTARATRLAGTAADRGGDPGPELVESPVVATTSTATDGSFVLPARSARSLTFSARGFADGFVDLPSGRDPRLGLVVLEPATVVTGRIVGEDGAVAGVTVAAVDRFARGGETRTTATDADGFFTLENFATERRQLLAVAGRGVLLELERLPQRSFDLGEIRLPDRHLVRGSVVDADGSAATGARVAAGAFALATPHYRAGGALTWIETETDTSGRFELRLPRGAYVLRTQAVGRFVESSQLEVAGGDVELRPYRLAPVTDITGTAIDDLGRPLPAVAVTLPPPPIELLTDGRWAAVTGVHVEPLVGVGYPPIRQTGWHQGKYALPTTLTDETGRYWMAVPTSLADPVLHFRKPGYISLDDTLALGSPFGILREVDLGASEQAPVRLPQATGIVGTIIDDDGVPMPGIRIDARADFWELNADMRIMGVTADAAGDFELPGLYPGTWSVRAYGPEVRTTELDGIEVAHGQATSIVVPVRRWVPPGRGHPVDARVEDPSGRPLSGIELSLEALDAEIEPSPSRYRFRTSGADGRARFDDVPPGRYLLQAHTDVARFGNRTAYAYVEVHVGPELQTTLLRLTPERVSTRILAGRVDDDRGQPIAGARVMAWLLEEGSRRRVFVGGRFLTTSDGSGSFRFEQLPAGRYALSASRNGYATTHQDVDLSASPEGARAGLSEITVTLNRGATVTGTLRGLVEDEIRGTTISTERAFADRTGPPLVRDDGTFEISNLGPGEWVVHATTRSGRTTRASIDVPLEVETIDLPLDFTPGHTMSGRVTYNGRPVREARVSVTGSQRFATTRRVTTAGDGSYLMHGLPADRYQAFVWANRTTYVEALEIGSDLEVDFDVRGAFLGGQLVDAMTGTGVTPGSLEVEPLPGGNAGTYNPGNGPYLSSDGRFRIGPLHSGRWRLRADVPGHATTFVTVEIGDEDVDGVEIRLERTAGLALNIRTERRPPSGVAPENVYLSWQSVDGDRTVTHAVVWSSLIETRWDNIPNGPGILTLYRPRGNLAARLRIDNQGEPIDVELAPAGSVLITVEGLTNDPQARLVIRDQDGIPVVGWGRLGGSFDGDGIAIRRGRRRVLLPAGAYQAIVTAGDGREWRAGFRIYRGSFGARLTLR